MVDPLFFLFITISILCYGLQGPLLVIFARKEDGVIVSVYRGLSFIITMLPLLFLSSMHDIREIAQHIPTLIFAAIAGAFALVCSLSAARYQPVGVGTAIRQVVYVTVALILGALFLQEYLSVVQLILLAGIAACAVSLALARHDHSHLDPTKRWRGAVLSACSGVGVAVSFYFFSILSRETSPYVATYFWEVSIGVVSLAYLLVLVTIGKYKSNPWLSWKQTGKLAFVSLVLTVGATLSYAFAVQYGPFALASGLMPSTILIATVMSWFLFKEKLHLRQIGLIVSAVILMIILRFVS